MRMYCIKNVATRTPSRENNTNIHKYDTNNIPQYDAERRQKYDMNNTKMRASGLPYHICSGAKSWLHLLRDTPYCKAGRTQICQNFLSTFASLNDDTRYTLRYVTLRFDEFVRHVCNMRIICDIFRAIDVQRNLYISGI
jgi:hypothetical protein